MINVGYLRRRKQPIPFVEILAKKSKEKDINLVYFTPEDIDIENKMVTGLTYSNGEWVETTVRLPWFIDIHAELFGSKKYKELITFLTENVTLSSNARFPLPWTRFTRYFTKESFFYDNVIMRKKVETIEDVKNAAKQYGAITLKPLRQRKEVNGYIVQCIGDDYKVYRRSDGVLLPEGLLSEEVQTSIQEMLYGTEKFIHPPEGTSEEADFNVQLEKGAEGNWHIVRMEMDQEKRIDLKSYIDKTFPESAEKLSEEVEDFVHHFAKVIERIRKYSYMTISINLVLDKDGKIYVRKVIPNPSVEGVEQTVAQLRADYYSYIAPPLEMTVEEEAKLQAEREENQKIEAELVEFHEEVERKRKLIEQGILKEEKAKITVFTVLIFIAIIFAMIRYSMRAFM